MKINNIIKKNNKIFKEIKIFIKKNNIIKKIFKKYKIFMKKNNSIKIYNKIFKKMKIFIKKIIKIVEIIIMMIVYNKMKKITLMTYHQKQNK